jgi:putative membrane protein
VSKIRAPGSPQAGRIRFCAYEEMNAMMYGQGYSGYGVMGGWLEPLVMLVFGVVLLAAVVMLVVWAVRGSSGRDRPAAPGPPPASAGHEEALGIAKKRLASGEITTEQYEEIVRALGT